VVFEWHLCFKASRISVEDDKSSGWPSTSKMRETLKKFNNSSWKTVDEQSMSLQTPLGPVMEFARRS
jgi:hypothetical protein